MRTPDCSCLCDIIHDRKQRSYSVQVFNRNRRQELQLRVAPEAVAPDRAGRQGKVVLPWPFPPSFLPISVRTATEPGKKFWKMQNPASRKPVMLPDHCSGRSRDFPTAVLHCWASAHTDHHPKLPLKPAAFFPVTAQGFGCGSLQPGVLAAAKFLACVLQAMGIDDHSYSF